MPQETALCQTTSDASVGISDYGPEEGSLCFHLCTCRIRASRNWRERRDYLSRPVGLERVDSGAMTNNHVINFVAECYSSRQGIISKKTVIMHVESLAGAVKLGGSRK
jgi:hypothetical protein